MNTTAYVGEIWMTRWLFQRGLAALFVVAFSSALNQFRPLLGERGLMPVPRFLAVVPFRKAPSIFHFHYSDRFFVGLAWTGIALSLAALLGLSEAGPAWLSLAVWLVLWGLYLSIVNVGQTFYAFGWESMLVEAAFFAAFLGPMGERPSVIPVLILRWMLFRVELGAGLIKLRNDECWRDLTCLFYHHETQPLPNPLSFYFHKLPKLVQKTGVVFSHFVQLVVPFGLFAPRPFAAIAGGFAIVHQLWLIVSGNYAWLNWLTVLLGVTTLDDAVLRAVLPLEVPALSSRGPILEGLLYVLLGATVLLSVRPTLNFFSRDQLMNYSYNPLHLVNAYGAFGSVTRERYEVVLEGGGDSTESGEEGTTPTTTEWREYEFKAKPGDLRRRPPQIAPYHLRLDWLMWFLPFSVSIIDGEVAVVVPERWFRRLVRKLLEGDRALIELLRTNPFPLGPPARIRAVLYRYEFTSAKERAATGAWWKRTRVGDYLPAVSLRDVGILRE